MGEKVKEIIAVDKTKLLIPLGTIVLVCSAIWYFAAVATGVTSQMQQFSERINKVENNSDKVGDTLVQIQVDIRELKTSVAFIAEAVKKN